MNSAACDARITRARVLAKRHPVAAEVLLFYAEIAGVQKSIYEVIPAGARFEKQLDEEVISSHFPVLLNAAQNLGSAALAGAAVSIREVGPQRWGSLLNSYWIASPVEETGLFFARAFLEPYAAALADRIAQDPKAARNSQCPKCRRKPLAGVLRAEEHGAKRSLICSFCATEWDYSRIVCPACGEQEFDELAIYTADTMQHVRVDACESCKSYLLSVDLTKDAEAVPIVDELASIPLNIWAQQQGYRKLQPNLLGL
jgi:FdhE protein